MIQLGNVVSVHYSGSLTNGELFDSSEGKEPITFQVGSGQIIPGFENAIMGKLVGDKVRVNIPADQAYGQVREDLIIRVEKDKMPGEVTAGMNLQAQSEDGQAVNVLVKEVNDDHVMIDGNHPLAGKELVFDIEVVSIQ